jgi:DNA-binding Lrp family transcriptional regulator
MATANRRQIMSDEELLQAVASCDEWADRPVTTASEIAERMDMSRQGVHRRLQSLHEDGEIRKYKPGRSAIWWIEEE